MLQEIKIRILTEEKRETIITDCNELSGRQDVTTIEYISEKTATTDIIQVDNPKYVLVTYRKYIFKIDDKLRIIDEYNNKNDDQNGDNNEENDESKIELEKYKKEIAQTITNLGVKTLDTQTANEYINNIKILADKNYQEGKESNIVLIKSDLNSRYTQTFSLTNIEGYENFDAEDFITVNKNMVCTNYNDREESCTIEKFYDKQSGTLTLGKQKSFVSKTSWTFWNTYDLYAIKRTVQDVNQNNVTTNSSASKKENLNDFKYKLSKALEDYGIENDEENPLIDKTAEEISEYIKKIARNKFEEGISTYMILIQADLSTRYDQTVTVDNIEGYNNLTMNDFLIVNKTLSYTSTCDGEEVYTMSKTYNSTTGTLEFGKQKSYAQSWTFWNTYSLYWLKKEIINLEN